MRAAALRQLFANGARPAIAFEQFDQEHQRDIERARRERPKDADYLIAQAGGNPAWNWDYYRPFVALGLEYDLPIVAANLSRNGAMRVALHGWSAMFDARTRRKLRLDALPADLRRKQEEAIAAGHCNLLPAKMVPAQARAQMARDIIIAQSIRPYVDRGVVLLAGNGHAAHTRRPGHRSCGIALRKQVQFGSVRLVRWTGYSGGGAALTVRFALRVWRLNARSTAALRKCGAAIRR